MEPYGTRIRLSASLAHSERNRMVHGIRMSASGVPLTVTHIAKGPRVHVSWNATAIYWKNTGIS